MKSRRKYCTYCSAFIPVWADECLFCGKKIEPIKKRGKRVRKNEVEKFELQDQG